MRTAPTVRMNDNPKNGECKCQPVIHRGMSPASVNGAMMKNSVDPKTAPARLISPRLHAFHVNRMLARGAAENENATLPLMGC